MATLFSWHQPIELDPAEVVGDYNDQAPTPSQEEALGYRRQTMANPSQTSVPEESNLHLQACSVPPRAPKQSQLPFPLAHNGIVNVALYQTQEYRVLGIALGTGEILVHRISYTTGIPFLHRRVATIPHLWSSPLVQLVWIKSSISSSLHLIAVQQNANCTIASSKNDFSLSNPKLKHERVISGRCRIPLKVTCAVGWTTLDKKTDYLILGSSTGHFQFINLKTGKRRTYSIQIRCDHFEIVTLSNYGSRFLFLRDQSDRYYRVRLESYLNASKSQLILDNYDEKHFKMTAVRNLSSYELLNIQCIKQGQVIASTSKHRRQFNLSDRMSSQHTLYSYAIPEALEYHIVGSFIVCIGTGRNYDQISIVSRYKAVSSNVPSIVQELEFPANAKLVRNGTHCAPHSGIVCFTTDSIYELYPESIDSLENQFAHYALDCADYETAEDFAKINDLNVHKLFELSAKCALESNQIQMAYEVSRRGGSPALVDLVPELISRDQFHYLEQALDELASLCISSEAKQQIEEMIVLCNLKHDPKLASSLTERSCQRIELILRLILNSFGVARSPSFFQIAQCTKQYDTVIPRLLARGLGFTSYHIQYLIQSDQSSMLYEMLLLYPSLFTQYLTCHDIICLLSAHRTRISSAPSTEVEQLVQALACFPCPVLNEIVERFQSSINQRTCDNIAVTYLRLLCIASGKQSKWTPHLLDWFDQGLQWHLSEYNQTILLQTCHRYQAHLCASRVCVQSGTYEAAAMYLVRALQLEEEAHVYEILFGQLVKEILPEIKEFQIRCRVLEKVFWLWKEQPVQSIEEFEQVILQVQYECQQELLYLFQTRYTSLPKFSTKFHLALVKDETQHANKAQDHQEETPPGVFPLNE